MSDNSSSNRLMKNLASVIVATRSYEDSKAKELLWCAYMSLISNSYGYSHLLQQQYISDNVITWRTDHGIAITTSFDAQLNVNLIVPLRSHETAILINEISDFRNTIWKRLIVNMLPISATFEAEVTDPDAPDRVIPSRRHIPNLVLSKDHTEVVCLNASVKVGRIIEDVRMLEESNARPLTRMTANDTCDTLYWHRFRCGTITLFTNGFRTSLPRLLHLSLIHI